MLFLYLMIRMSMFLLRENENRMKRKEDGTTTEGSNRISSTTMKNSSHTKCHNSDGLAGTMCNSLTASSNCGMESNNNNVKMGKLDNAHQL